MMPRSRNSLTRRRILEATGLATAGLLAGCAGGGSDGGSGGSDGGSGGSDGGSGGGGADDGKSDGGGSGETFGGWLEGVSNYDGVVDKTGSSEVTVKVGAKGNDGYYAFAPAAVKVSSGTTVKWVWTGEGGSHNVVAKDGSYESELVSDKGHTFTHTFRASGVSKYLCEPHKSLGMKGVVVID